MESQPPTAAEDEALKKNTDCVYFLASPLTCKKGSECEYRHSDIARVNPRDCWFWLNSNCLNPKCGFRHPPLDGLLGTQMLTPTGPSPPSLQTVATTSANVPGAPNKQAVPCVFFQKGYCMKGDWCTFLHEPNSMSNKAPLVPEAVPATRSTFKKAFEGVDKLTQKKKVQSTDVANSVKVTPQVKSSMEGERTLPIMESSVNKRTPQTSFVHEQLSEYKNVASVGNGNPRVQQPRLVDESGSMNNKDVEEVSREPSPEFDVLVDDKQGDPGYYPGEVQYGMSREHESRNEYDISHSSDYSMIADIANERYQDHPLPYGSHERFKEHQYAWEHGASSERMSGGSSFPERRPYARMDSCGQVDKLDLRYRLAKHKKGNGLRSVISHEHARNSHVEDQSYQGFCRDEQHLSRHENSLSSRLRGRIRLPGRSRSPTDGDMVRACDRGRLSPGRTTLSSTQERIRNRINGRAEEAFSDGGGNYRGLHSSRRDIMNVNSANFSGPKSLSELKNKKNGECSGHNVTDKQSLGKRKHLMLDGHNRSDGDDTSFDRPKPLQEILKHKRGGETIGSASVENSSNNENIIVEDNNRNEVDKSASAEKTDVEESKVQADDGIWVEDGKGPEYEAYEQRGDGEHDYEQEGGGEEFELYDGDNGEIEGEEEYPDEEDDDDDFAKKMGVVYSV